MTDRQTGQANGTNHVNDLIRGSTRPLLPWPRCMKKLRVQAKVKPSGHKQCDGPKTTGPLIPITVADEPSGDTKRDSHWNHDQKQPACAWQRKELFSQHLPK